jgi:hypothetical protein
MKTVPIGLANSAWEARLVDAWGIASSSALRPVVAAAEDFLAGAWAPRNETFVFATRSPCSCASTEFELICSNAMASVYRTQTGESS